MVISLPRAYKILPYSIDFHVPGFAFDPSAAKTLSLQDRDSGEWFNEFVDRVRDSLGRQYFPVCRMSDGVFRFALGELPPDSRWPFQRRLKYRTAQVINAFLRLGAFQVNVLTPTARLFYGLRLRTYSEVAILGTYRSGEYSLLEWLRGRPLYAELMRHITKHGALAIHLMYGPTPDQGHYAALAKWFNKEQIVLNERNYVPLPFVYAALTGLRRGELLEGKRILIATHAEDKKRTRIEATLRREGVADVLWQEIAPQKALYDRLDVRPHIGRVDMAVVGAGVGTPNILVELEPLQVPCLDGGFIIEVWEDPTRGKLRAFCAPEV